MCTCRSPASYHLRRYLHSGSLRAILLRLIHFRGHSSSYQHKLHRFYLCIYHNRSTCCSSTRLRRCRRPCGERFPGPAQSPRPNCLCRMRRPTTSSFHTRVGSRRASPLGTLTQSTNTQLFSFQWWLSDCTFGLASASQTAPPS